MTQTNVKYSDLRQKTPDDLDEQINQLRQQLTTLQLRPNQIETIRQSIARLQIVKNQKRKENLREFYRDKTHQPKDLRPKKTRAMRRQLTDEEKSISLRKTQRRNVSFPQRIFTIKTNDDDE